MHHDTLQCDRNARCANVLKGLLQATVNLTADSAYMQPAVFVGGSKAAILEKASAGRSLQTKAANLGRLSRCAITQSMHKVVSCETYFNDIWGHEQSNPVSAFPF